jgi:membrane protease subunit (stomatin/prohibitin family)
MWQFLIAFVVVFAVGITIRVLITRNKKTSQTPPAAPTSTAPPPQAVQDSKCPNCGTTVAADAAFCGNCGAKLK